MIPTFPPDSYMQIQEKILIPSSKDLFLVVITRTGTEGKDDEEKGKEKNKRGSWE